MATQTNTGDIWVGDSGVTGNGSGGGMQLKPGDFFLFPYDLRHFVYPFRGKEKRISLAMNVDVAYDVFSSRQG